MALDFNGRLPTREDAAARVAELTGERVQRRTVSDADEVLRKVSSINATTANLAKSGFTFNGVELSSSLESQVRWLGAYNNRASLTYPFTIMSLDDKSTVDVQSSADIEALYLALFNHVQSAITSGVDLKKQVINASSVADMKNIVDNR